MVLISCVSLICFQRFPGSVLCNYIYALEFLQYTDSFFSQLSQLNFFNICSSNYFLPLDAFKTGWIFDIKTRRGWSR